MRRTAAGAGTALFFATVPGVVVGAVPWTLTHWRVEGQLPGGARAAGAMVVLAGVVLLVHSFVRFVVEGAGTPAPPAPTEHLVVGGLYRVLRNPMYVAVLAAVLGQALLLGQPVLVVYAAVVGAAMWSFVHWHEEPTLRRRFGPAYDAYRAQVPGWWPRPLRRQTATMSRPAGCTPESPT
jgi:protein-S-isoprenylcysteine O-methyltransferase Ste14